MQKVSNSLYIINELLTFCHKVTTCIISPWEHILWVLIRRDGHSGSVGRAYALWPGHCRFDPLVSHTKDFKNGTYSCSFPCHSALRKESELVSLVSAWVEYHVKMSGEWYFSVAALWKWALSSLPHPDTVGMWLKDYWKWCKAWIKQTNN